MGKRSGSTSNLKKDRRKKRKNIEQKRQAEKSKNHVLATTPLKNTIFLCDHKGSVYRFFKKEEHADALARGDVYLSTLESCRAYEDDEQGDSEEAYETYLSGYLRGDSDDPQFVEQARRSGVTVVNSYNGIISNNSVIESLVDAYLLCTTTEFLPENLNEKFGKYCVEIKDPRKFFIAISRNLNSRFTILEAATRKVIYADRKYTGMEQPPGPIGFVKPSFPYEKQKEFRFLWRMESKGKLEPILIECPEISKLCRRIA